jgi:ribosomal protein RSM22 (predicted rRNA methylase)
MELPAALRHAVDLALEGTALGDLTRAADLLSRRYRAETRDGRLHLDDDLAALAYLTTRLPATYAAIRAAITMVSEHLPDFAPLRHLDLGAGPGTALWAALDCWPKIEAAILIEGSPAIRHQGELLVERALPASAGGHTEIAWCDGDLGAFDSETTLAGSATADLVTLCYVLDELAPAARDRVIDWAWSRCEGVLLIVEPGTPAGWHRILATRDQLLAAGGRIIAPCPHEQRCPLLPPTASHQDSHQVGSEVGSWCHFSRRVARSRLHRLAKQADVPWEDEKFAYLAIARQDMLGSSDIEPFARIIASPRGGSGRLQLQLCDSDGTQRERLISRRDGDLYKLARRLDWGDILPSTSAAVQSHRGNKE